VLQVMQRTAAVWQPRVNCDHARRTSPGMASSQPGARHVIVTCSQPPTPDDQPTESRPSQRR
jgi:hypothetical protein